MILAPRRNGKMTRHRELVESAASAGEHTHEWSSSKVRCYNGTPECSVWAKQAAER